MNNPRLTTRTTSSLFFEKYSWLQWITTIVNKLDYIFTWASHSFIFNLMLTLTAMMARTVLSLFPTVNHWIMENKIFQALKNQFNLTKNPSEYVNKEFMDYENLIHSLNLQQNNNFSDPWCEMGKVYEDTQQWLSIIP